jgi:hypothetical protein
VTGDDAYRPPGEQRPPAGPVPRSEVPPPPARLSPPGPAWKHDPTPKPGNVAPSGYARPAAPPQGPFGWSAPPGLGGYPPPAPVSVSGGNVLGQMRLRHRPGRGLVVGVCGLAALLLSFFALPWISEGGDELTFKDLRDIFNPDEQATSAGQDVGVPSEGPAAGIDPQLAPSTISQDPNAVPPGVPGKHPRPCPR